MGLKITKCHAITHMAQDIADFGVPMNFGTGSDEAGHKSSKSAAKATQKRKETFGQQLGKRLAEAHCLDLAQEEISSGRPIWQCYEPRADPPTPKSPPQGPRDVRLSGAKYAVAHDLGPDRYYFCATPARPSWRCAANLSGGPPCQWKAQTP